MQLWYRDSILEFENGEVCNLFFEAFKSNQSFAKTTSNIIRKLNAKKQQLEQNLADLEKAYKSIKHGVSFAIDENPNQNYCTFLKYSTELDAKIAHVDFLKYEVFQAFKNNQTNLFAEFVSNPEKFTASRQIEMKKTAEETNVLYQKFDNTKCQLAEVLKTEVVTLDQLLFVESQINTLQEKINSFPFSTEEDYSEMIENATLIEGMSIEDSQENENE